MKKKELGPPLNKKGLYDVIVRSPDDEDGNCEDFNIPVWAGDSKDAAMKALNTGFAVFGLVYPSALFITYRGTKIFGAVIVNTTTAQHASDCAVHNAPASKPGPCNCGAEPAEDQPTEPAGE